MCGEQYYVSRLIALWTETVFWGLYIAVFSECVYALAQRRDKPKFILPVSVIMFLICSTLVIIDFVVVLLNHDVVANSSCVGATCNPCNMETTRHLDQVLLEDLMRPIQQSLFATNLFFADGLLIYRYYILANQTRWSWSRWIVVLPILLLLASLAIAYAQVPYGVEIWRIRRDAPLSAPPPPDWVSINELYNNLSIASFVLSLTTTILTTFLIASCVWWYNLRELEKEVGRGKGSKYRRSIALLIESGAMYSASLIIMVIVWFTSPTYMPIPEYAMRQIMGISPTLIIVRLGLSKGVESTLCQLTDSYISQALRPTLPLEFGRRQDGVESNSNTADVLTSIKTNVSDRVPGSPPMECAELGRLSAHEHSHTRCE